MTHISKKIGLAAILAAALVGTSMANEKVVVADGNWITGHVAHFALVEGIKSRFPSLTVESVPSSMLVMYEAMDRGRGDIDVHPDIWLPNQQTQVDEYVTNRGTVRLSENYFVANTGYCVPAKFAEEHNLKTMQDLKNPDVVKQLDRNGDGKAEVWIGGHGWNSAYRNRVQIRDYGLEPYLEPVQLDELVAYAQLGDAVAKGEGYLFNCYGPHYVFAQYELTQLEEPPHDPNLYEIFTPKDGDDWMERSRAMTAAPQPHGHIGYAASLEERLPEVARFLSQWSFAYDDLVWLADEIAQKGRDPHEAAREWVDNNADRLDSWMSQ